MHSCLKTNSGEEIRVTWLVLYCFPAKPQDLGNMVAVVCRILCAIGAAVMAIVKLLSDQKYGSNIGI